WRLAASIRPESIPFRGRDRRRAGTRPRASVPPATSSGVARRPGDVDLDHAPEAIRHRGEADGRALDLAVGGLAHVLAQDLARSPDHLGRSRELELEADRPVVVRRLQHLRQPDAVGRDVARTRQVAGFVDDLVEVDVAGRALGLPLVGHGVLHAGMYTA